MRKFIFVLTMLTLLGLNALAKDSKSTPRNVKDEHLRCYESSECSLSYNSCCGAIAVNKKFAKLYKFSYDLEECAAVSCLEITPVCYEQKCSIEKPKRR